MASHRSLTTTWQRDSSNINFTKLNGRFWQKRKMNGPSLETPALAFQSEHSSISPSADMSQIDNHPKQPPQPSGTEYSSQRDSSPPSYENVFRKFHQHTLSDSSNTVGSNDSSPTTTISTVDDSSATEPSPGSSPESPPPTTFAVGMLRPRTAHDRTTPFFELQKQPPPKKGRNLKGLAVNTTRQTATAKGASASTTSLPLRIQTEDASTILSPSFVKPPTPSRRKPSNLGLTILTPGVAKPPPQLVKLTIPGVPQTPGFQRPTLRHFQSSPSLPLVPGLGVQSNRSYQQQQALETIFSPVELQSSPQIDEEEEEEQNFDIPLSREEKPEAYPDGPICVYDPRIDLYLEPTAEQARQYDVIMNVASEVRNPFVAHNEPVPAEPDLRLDGGGGIQYAPKRDRLGVQSTDATEASPTTPKATPVEPNFPSHTTTSKEPEYIHIPWEHNSDIVPDLFRLVKVIDEKVNEGKSILVHCQCGVSRSASLVVAYGIYKNPAMSVQEAYDAVKKRSKWIGPNMNLIMQLQEFRSSLARGGILGDRTLSPLTPGSALSEWKGPFSSSNPTPLRNGPLSAVVAPANRAATDENTAVTPGPASAPLAPWAINGKGVSSRNRAVSAVKPATAYVDPSGHVVVPVLKVISADSPYAQTPPVKPAEPAETTPETIADPTPSSPRSSHFAMTPLTPPEEVDPADSFGIMSPTSTEFSSSPFDRLSLLASLGMGSMRADEETPRRSLSLRNRAKSQTAGQNTDLQPGGERRLRGKISSPNLREQQQLQNLQAKIEATLPARLSPQTEFNDMHALMSPRATEFTDNPFALPLPPDNNASSSVGDTSPAADPRSPALKGANPITRNILDVL